mgnify:CR=1 FL=1
MVRDGLHQGCHHVFPIDQGEHDDGQSASGAKRKGLRSWQCRGFERGPGREFDAGLAEQNGHGHFELGYLDVERFNFVLLEIHFAAEALDFVLEPEDVSKRVPGFFGPSP